jgi:predicted metal-dependent peptidase
MAPPVALTDRDTLAATEMERVHALRATLIADHPFWASLLLPMQIRPSFTLPTFGATDCLRSIWVNPYWTSALKIRQLGYVLIHEVCHVAFLHALRQAGRDLHKWNLATDISVNALVDDIKVGDGIHGMRPLYDRSSQVVVPGRGVISLIVPPDWAKGLLAEEIYERLPDPPHTCPLCQGSHGSGQPGSQPGPSGPQPPGDNAPTSDPAQSSPQNGSAPSPNGEPDWSRGHCQPGHTCLQVPPVLGPDDAEELTDRVQAAYEAWTASSQRGTMPAAMTRLVEFLRSAKVPWQRVLHQVAGSALAHDDYSLFPPHARWLHEADILRPTLRSTRLAILVIAVDTSGSITLKILRQFAPEMAKLHTLSEETLILTCDAQIHQVIPTAKVPEFLATLNFTGGGGTSHIPVFDWLREHRHTPDLLVALTDLHSEFPDQKPPYPVLWCAPPEHGTPPPWGRLVVIPEDPD